MASRIPFEGARAFLYAAEGGSFAAAAERLNLSAGAVTQRIQALEAFLQETLFERKPAGTRLTRSGRRLYDELREPLHGVESALMRPRTAGSRRRLSVSAAPAFAARWLMPRIQDFSTRYPDIELYIDADPRPVRFDGPVPDLAIRYGAGPYDDLETVELFRPRAVLCAHPNLLEDIATTPRLDEILALPLLRHGHQVQWQQWLDAHRVPEHAVRWGPWYSDDILLREALLSGQGIGLAREPFVHEDLRKGTLVQLFDSWQPDERYWLVGPTGVFERGAPSTFREWLLRVFDNREDAEKVSR